MAKINRPQDENGIDLVNMTLFNEIAQGESQAVQELSDQLTQETTRATAAEAVLTAAIEAEETRATAAEGVLTNNLAGEITRATAAEEALETTIENNRTTLDTKIDEQVASVYTEITATNTKVGNNEEEIGDIKEDMYVTATGNTKKDEYQITPEGVVSTVTGIKLGAGFVRPKGKLTTLRIYHRLGAGGTIDELRQIVLMSTASVNLGGVEHTSVETTFPGPIAIVPGMTVDNYYASEYRFDEVEIPADTTSLTFIFNNMWFEAVKLKTKSTGTESVDYNDDSGCAFIAQQGALHIQVDALPYAEVNYIEVPRFNAIDSALTQINTDIDSINATLATAVQTIELKGIEDATEITIGEVTRDGDTAVIKAHITQEITEATEGRIPTTAAVWNLVEPVKASVDTKLDANKVFKFTTGVTMPVDITSGNATIDLSIDENVSIIKHTIESDVCSCLGTASANNFRVTVTQRTGQTTGVVNSFIIVDAVCAIRGTDNVYENAQHVCYVIPVITTA